MPNTTTAAETVAHPTFAEALRVWTKIGLLSFGKLGVDRTPNVDLPIVTVRTTLRGASPEEMETQVTKIIEDAVSTCAGIDELRSTSVEGVSIAGKCMNATLDALVVSALKQ